MTDIPDPEEMLARTGAEPNTNVAQDTLPPVTTLSIDCKDGRGREYKGEFYFTVPTLGDRLQIGNMKLGYLPGGEPPDNTALGLVHMICYLTASITFNEKFKKPHWWDFWNLYDATPFTALYREATQYEARFLGEDQNAGYDEDSHRGEDTPEQRDGEAPVGRKVRPPNERRETLAAHGAGSS